MEMDQDLPSAKRQRLGNGDSSVGVSGQGEDPSLLQFTSERLNPSETPPPSPIPGLRPPNPINIKKENPDNTTVIPETPDVKTGGVKIDSKYKNLKLNMVEPAGGGSPQGNGKGGEAQVPLTGAYMSREENLQEMEDAGKIQFSCAGNDGVVQHMIWLIGLKNIFSKQLPNMPKEYIVRLVMDRNHKSMMLIKQNTVIGGITYRPYPTRRFGEIAFCAITSTEQVKGFGTRLMNHLKQHARDVDNLEYFLTYADNNAVGYFGKQGFTKEITMDRERWHGYIKDYDGGTLMECHIHPTLPHTTLAKMLRMQKQAIEEKVRQLSNQHVVHPGLDTWKKAGYGRKAISIEEIPGVREAGWQPDPHSHLRIRLVNTAGDRPPTKSSLHAFMRSVLRAVGDHPDAWPFKEPVNARDVPDYYDIIKEPMDLKTISRRLDGEAYYVTLEIFNSDMRRVFANARIYNAPDTIYYKASTKLETFFSHRMKAGLQIGGRPMPSHRPGKELTS